MWTRETPEVTQSCQGVARGPNMTEESEGASHVSMPSHLPKKGGVHGHSLHASPW